MNASPKPQVILANTEAMTSNVLVKMFQELKFFEPLKLDSIQKIFDDPPVCQYPKLALIDAQFESTQALEWVQSLKMTYPSCPIFVLHGPNNPLAFFPFKKNGADLLIHFHFDREFIIDLILEKSPASFTSEIPVIALNPIDLREIHPEMEVNFDIYVHLPSNGKTVLLKKAGQLIDESTLKKFGDFKQNLYFKKTETKQFLEYARTALTMKNSESPFAMTEKLLKSKKFVFNIMSELFNRDENDYGRGKKILENCKSIINEYQLLKPRSPEEIKTQIMNFIGASRSFYNDIIHITNISCLMAQLLDYKTQEIEHLALAGILHNIGLSEIPQYHLHSDPNLLNHESKIKYFNYPTASVLLVKSQKVPLEPEVSTIMLQQRENTDGTGFPNKLPLRQINPLARILRLAIRLQELTGLLPNQTKLTFSAALKFLNEESVSGKSPHDLSQLMTLLKKLE